MVVGFGPEANKPEFVQRREDIAGDKDRVFQITDANALQTLAQAIKTSVCS